MLLYDYILTFNTLVFIYINFVVLTKVVVSKNLKGNNSRSLEITKSDNWLYEEDDSLSIEFDKRVLEDIRYRIKVV